MNNFDNKDDIYEEYKKLAINATRFIDSNKNVNEVTNELFVDAVEHLLLLYNSFNKLYAESKSENVKRYSYCHKLHKKTCNKIFKFIKRSKIFVEKNINFFKWNHYIYRYNNDLAIIKQLLNNSSEEIKKCKKKLNEFIICKKTGNYNSTTLSRDVTLPFILNTAISLRYCIELIVFQLKNNNVNELKNLNLDNKITFFDLLTKYEEENIDFNIKDLSNENDKLIIKDFWTKDKLCDIHTKLSKIVHFQNKKHVNWNFKDYKKIEKYNNVELDIKELTKILKTLFISMKDHNVSFERSKFNANVKDFYIDINKLFNIN